MCCQDLAAGLQDVCKFARCHPFGLQANGMGLRLLENDLIRGMGRCLFVFMNMRCGFMLVFTVIMFMFTVIMIVLVMVVIMHVRLFMRPFVLMIMLMFSRMSTTG